MYLACFFFAKNHCFSVKKQHAVFKVHVFLTKVFEKHLRFKKAFFLKFTSLTVAFYRIYQQIQVYQQIQDINKYKICQ